MRLNVVLVAMLVGAATLAVAAEPSAAVTPAGGRVQLADHGRAVDTRLGPKPTGPVNLLVSLGLVYVLDATTSGTATIYPCGGTPGPDPSLLFEAGEIVYARFASSTPQCIVSSTPADFVVDSVGGVDATPSPTDLQYVQRSSSRASWHRRSRCASTWVLRPTPPRVRSCSSNRWIRPRSASQSRIRATARARSLQISRGRTAAPWDCRTHRSRRGRLTCVPLSTAGPRCGSPCWATCRTTGRIR